jgi:predicted DNA-binding transcriptional regulator YafY
MGYPKNNFLMSEETRQNRLKRVLEMIKLLTDRPKTVHELMSITGTSERTVYRYLNLIESTEISIDKNFHNQYFISQDKCPLCNCQRG